MRGKLTTMTVPRDDKRNIPAYAGKTIADMAYPTSGEEHPRVCGENSAGE